MSLSSTGYSYLSRSLRGIRGLSPCYLSGGLSVLSDRLSELIKEGEPLKKIS